MSVEFISYAAVGAILIVLGFLTWKKQKVSILHSYHYQNVKEEDLPAYTKSMGIGQIVIGIGLCLTGVVRLFTLDKISWAPAIVLGIIGLAIFHKAQMKYNGGWFSLKR